jgi:hypothetical protein
VGEEAYLSYNDKQVEAHRLGLEIVPKLYEGIVSAPAELLSLLQHESILGGQKIEGIVIKNYQRFGLDKKVLMGKYVSEAFKEVHSAEWKESNPTKNDIIQKLILQLKTPARWAKAVQHLRESGTLTHSPKDIGALIKEVQQDTEAECREDIKDALYSQAMPHIKRGIIGGLPEWYKEKLMQSQFEEPNETSTNRVTNTEADPEADPDPNM